MGLDIALACLTEAPIFFFAGAIVEKLGVNRALNISAVAFAARCLVSLPALSQALKVESFIWDCCLHTPREFQS